MEATSLSMESCLAQTLAAGGGLDSTQLLMLVLGVVALTMLMLATRRRLRQSHRQPQVPSMQQVARRAGPVVKATRDLEQVMLELDQVSREIHGRLDTKLARLEALIRDADQRIAKLSHVLRTPKATPEFEVTLEREDPPELFPQKEDRGAVDDAHVDIHQLADRGMSSVEIAQQVGRTPGEVELILALRQTKDRAQKALGSQESVAADL